MITKTRLALYKNKKLDIGIPLTEAAVTIGRDNGNSVQLPDTKVSKFHASVSPEKGQWTLEDLGSTNGTTVNGKAVKKATLASGDRIGIGSFDLYFETSVSEEWIPSFMMDHSTMISNQTIIQDNRKP